MKFHTSMVYPAGPAAVVAMMVDPVFIEAKLIASGSLGHQYDVTPGVDGAFRVTTRRSMPNDTVPANFRALVGPTVEIRTVEAWEPAEENGNRAGTMTVEAVGAPIRLVATTAFTASDDGSTVTVVVDGDLKAGIPLFGSIIEDAMNKGLLAAGAQEERVGVEYLTAS